LTIETQRPGSSTLATRLLQLTVMWNIIEGFVAVGAGIVAGSVALVGFGLDSFIEVTAAGVLLWRTSISNSDERVEARERLAQRIVGATFVALAGYIVAQTAYILAAGEQPESASVGLVLALVSLVVMPAIGLLKRNNARKLGSPALIAESTETLICSYLAFTLFAGLAANAFFGWGWADVAAALAMVPWIVKEGIEGLRAEDCEAEALAGDARTHAGGGVGRGDQHANRG
jgi:divalent metal cation (Fe/Co/Zn/Cd) transporter